MDFISVIEKLAFEKTCIIGMGNNLKQDDAVGIYVAEGVRKRLTSNDVTVINVEDVLENYVFSIADNECENVLIIDAVHLNDEGDTGSIIFGKLNELNEVINNYSTHKLSLFLSGKVLEHYNKKIWLLGIKVREIDFGIGLTKKVKKSADIIIQLLVSSLNCKRKELIYEY